ncbi:hypothetical protein VTK56DRAFT_9656 [Thermocarpiscus australiensis]
MEPNAATSHEEIWDDSALVESWNQALEEYKKYHSIHAKGGTVDDGANGLEETTPRDARPETTGASGAIAQQEQGDVEAAIPMDESDETPHPAVSDARGSVDAEKGNGVLNGGPPSLGPQMLLGNIQDEELKKLLMSWYYAGYYTGLFEGKQQGLQQAERSRTGS